MRQSGEGAEDGGRIAPSPVEAKVVLVDPDSGTVVWMNESARADLPGGANGIGLPLAQAVPLADTLALEEAVAQVVAEGGPQHREVSLVSTSRGSLTIVASVYLLPTCQALIVFDRTFQPGARVASAPGERGRRRR